MCAQHSQIVFGHCKSWTYCKSCQRQLWSCCMQATGLHSHKRYCCTTLGTVRLVSMSNLQRQEVFVLCREPAQRSCRMLFGNVSFLQRFGPPRSQKEFSDTWASMSEAEQAIKLSCFTGTLQVAFVLSLITLSALCTVILFQGTRLCSPQGCKVHQARMNVYDLLWPLFERPDAAMLQPSANIHSKVQCSLMCFAMPSVCVFCMWHGAG